MICHGIPDERPLLDGDIVNCDITILKNGVNADLNETFMVGETVDADSKFLVIIYNNFETIIVLKDLENI